MGARVWLLLALNRTVAVPADHRADADPLAQDPETVQVSDPKAMYEDTEVIARFPLTVTSPDVLVMAPPDRVTVLSVMALVPFARVPPETVRTAATDRAEPSEAVPVATVMLLKGCIIATVVEAVKITVLVPETNVAFGAVALHAPPTLMVEPRARSVPLVPRVTEPAVMPRFAAVVSRMVFPVGVVVELRTVRSPPTLRAFVASVYVMPFTLVVSNVTAPANSGALARNAIA